MPSYHSGQRSDQVRVYDSGSEVLIMGVAGTVSGVTPLAAGGANGTGLGRIQQTADGRLKWKAPGSSTYGTAVTIGADGAYVLEDGDDAGAFLRVEVDDAFRPAAPAEAVVHLQDRFNSVGIDDVTAGEASAGSVESKTLTLQNDGAAAARSILVWIDASVSGLEISDDNATWVSPTTEGAALSLGDLAPGGTVPLYLRRTISAATSSDPDVEHILHRSWKGV